VEVLSGSSPGGSVGSDGTAAALPEHPSPGSGCAHPCTSAAESSSGGLPSGGLLFEAESGDGGPLVPALSVRESIPLFSLSGASSVESSLLAGVKSCEDEEFLSRGARQSLSRLVGGGALRAAKPQLAPVAEVSFDESPASSSQA
jgi:hypothetical protein